MQTLFMCWHGELGASVDGIRPALHDRLLFGVEAHALFAVGMGVTEQRTLPAAKTVPRHGHRDRHVDTDHTHLDTAAKLPCHAAALGETAYAVAELVSVDQLNGGSNIRHPHTSQHRAEDLFLVDRHLRGNVVKQRAAHPEAFATPLTCRSGIKLTAVDHQFGTFSHAFLDIAGNALVSRCGDDGTHLGIQLKAVLDL